MAIPKGDGALKRFFQSTAPYDIGQALGGFGAALTGSVKYFHDNQTDIGAGLVVLAAVICALAVMKFVIQFRQQEKKEAPHDLESALHALHAVLLLGVQKDQDPRLRITVHVPQENNTKLYQLLDYVGDDRTKNTKGRTFPALSGIIGQVLRTGDDSLRGKRSDTDPQKYIDELVRCWSYSLEEAAKRDVYAMAWQAIPLKDGDGKVVAVVYFDSVDPEFFTDVRLELSVNACAGVAKYVKKRYT